MRQQPAAKQIPRYALYGERSLPADADPVHVEAIAARSGPAGWHIKPHRHGSIFQVLCIEAGEARIQVDEFQQQLSGPWVLTLPVGTVHGFRFQPGTRGYVLSIAEPLLLSLQQAEAPLAGASLLHEAHSIPFRDDPGPFAQLCQLLGLLDLEQGVQQVGRLPILQSLCTVVLLQLRRQQQQLAVQAGPAGERQRLLLQFRRELDQHLLEHWSVEQYAQALCVSASTLNRLTRELFDASAKEVIQQHLLREMKRRLIYTGESLEQIAGALGFKDPAYFSRVFRRQTGHSPSQYRSQHLHENQ